jgi:MFS family permease
LFTLASSTDAFLLLRARDTGMPLWQLPLLWAVFHAVKAAAGVPGGVLADRLGRVRTIIAGWIVYAISYVGFAFVAGPTQLWGLFAFYALFYALTEGAERALVADLVPANFRGRAFGAFHASIGLASLPASILFGVWWKAFGPHAAFLIGAAIALAASVALAIFGVRTSRMVWRES